MIMQIMIHMTDILIWHKTRLCTKFEAFGPRKTELRAKEVGEFSIMLYGKMGWGRSLTHQHGCHNINV